MNTFRNTTALLLLLPFFAGCTAQRPLMPVPNLYSGEDAPGLFTRLPPELQDSQIDLLYVTDRSPEVDGTGELTYGFERSHSAAFGSAVVAIEPGLSWGELKRVSLEQKRSPKLTLRLDSLEERGRFPATPQAFMMIDGEPRPDPAVLEKTRQTKLAFQSEVRRRLALAPKSEVVLFIHGYNNSFEEAAQTLAELWHFLGREQVPILYAWPAGRGGPSGYIYDRESGEFTVFHLKNLLRSLAGIPEIEKVHLIAHSRGTDVLSSAIRELTIETRASAPGGSAQLKRVQLIMAAPDMDLDVVSQRIVAEQLGRELGEITVYTSQDDRAIGIAEWFFNSDARIGRVEIGDLQVSGLASVAAIREISLIDVNQKSGGTGHGYFHTNPAASSDLILLVRYGLKPGAENGRPLTPVAAGFWKIEPWYPKPSAGIE